MVTQFCILILFFCALAIEPQPSSPLTYPLAYKFTRPLPLSAFYQFAGLTGRLENNDGKLRLVFSNGSPQQIRGTCRISLGGDEDQKEIGQIELALPPQEIVLLQLNNVPPSGNRYTLAIYDQKGVRRFFKIAPLGRVSDPTPAVAVTLMPVQPSVAKASTPLLTVNNPSPSRAEVNIPDDFASAASQVQVQARLLANEDANDSFILSLEFRSQRPVSKATIAIAAGKVKDQKIVSINPQSHVEFKLPDQLETERVSYTLTGKDGRILAKGELDLQQLMADDFVTVNDIRTDRSFYDPGETARITVILEGQSQHGRRLEVSARDGQGQNLFRDQKMIRANDNINSYEFTISIPNGVIAPVIFEFKIFDSETELLFDSGEREIPMNNTNTKPSRPPES